MLKHVFAFYVVNKVCKSVILFFYLNHILDSIHKFKYLRRVQLNIKARKTTYKIIQ